jgi:hypothetical protein
MMAVVGQAAQAAADDSEEASSDDISTSDNKKGLTTPACPCKSQRGRMFDHNDLADRQARALDARL